MKNIIGIDISKEYFDACINNKVTRYKNVLNGFQDFIPSIPLARHSCLFVVSSVLGTLCHRQKLLYKMRIKNNIYNM